MGESFSCSAPPAEPGSQELAESAPPCLLSPALPVEHTVQCQSPADARNLPAPQASVPSLPTPCWCRVLDAELWGWVF